MRVEGWVAGERAKIEFVASDNAAMPPGTYLVTQDGGKTLYFVNPEQKTYAEWNLDQMLQTLGSVMQAMGPLLKFEISDVHVEKLGDEPGPELLGLPTRHYRYRTTYDMKIKVMGMGRSSAVDRMQDLWTTQALGDPGLGVWLRKEPPTTGDPDLDKLIATEMAKIQGFPLKTVEVSTTTDAKKGSKSETRIETEVTTLDRNAGCAGLGLRGPAGLPEDRDDGARCRIPRARTEKGIGAAIRSRRSSAAGAAARCPTDPRRVVRRGGGLGGGWRCRRRRASPTATSTWRCSPAAR